MRTKPERFIYEEMPAKKKRDNLTRFHKAVGDFSKILGDRYGSIKYHWRVVTDIYRRIDQRADYYLFFHSRDKKQMRMSQAKEAALLAYWVVKYKPLYLNTALYANNLYNDKNCTINEYFAVYCIENFVKSAKPECAAAYFTPETVGNLVYNFMHRDFSKEAMICVVSSIIGGQE